MTLVAALSGALVLGGLWLAVTSWRPVPEPPAQGRLLDRLSDLEARRVIAAVVGALVALVVTRWPIAAIAGALVGWALAGGTGRRARRDRQQRTEAIALWAEMLRDTVGTARGVEGVLVATAATAPAPIRPEVQQMAHRLQHEPLDVALIGLSRDLDHPVADLVVNALRLTATAGGGQVREVLDSLATAAYAEAESRSRIEVARERPRAAMRYTALVIGGFVTLLVLFSGQYLRPYSSPVGQLVLVIVGAYWGAGIWWMRRMGRDAEPERFMIDVRTEAMR